MQESVRILFLCTGNSCRSQMAEGFARALRPELTAFSAGVVARGLDPLAVEVMAEAGVDISGQTSKRLEELSEETFDYVVTLCGHAKEHCPFFPGRTRRVHKGFDDPPELARSAADRTETMQVYRRVRDEIRDWVMGLPGNLDDEAGQA